MSLAKESFIVVVDLGRSMCEDRSNKKDVAVKAVTQVIQQKMIYSKKDEINVIICGTEETVNGMAQEGLEGYEHIKDLYGGYRRPEMAAAVYVMQEPDSAATGDIFASLLLGIASLINTKGFKKGQGRVMIITDFESPSPFSDQVDAIIGALVDNEISLLVVGCEPGEQPQDGDGGHDNVVDHATHGRTKAGKRERAGHAASAPSATAVQNISAMHSIIEGVRAGNVQVEYLVARDALALLAGARSKAVNLVTKFRGTLDIGESVKIPIYTYAHTAEAKLPTLKKTTQAAAASSSSAAAGGGDEDGGGGSGYGSGYGAGAGGGGAAGDAGDGGGGVTFERKYLRTDMDTGPGAEITPDRMLKGYKYGRDIVPVSSEDISAVLKWESEKHLKVIGVQDGNTIPRYAYLGSVDVVVPSQAPKDLGPAGAALSAFVRGLHAKGKIAICRYVKRCNAAPLMVAAIPALARPDGQEENDDADVMEASVLAGQHAASAVPFSTSDAGAGGDGGGSRVQLVSDAPLVGNENAGPAYKQPTLYSRFPFDCLYLVPLPFLDDVRPFIFDPPFTVPAEHAPSDDQLRAMDAYIDGMDLAAVGGYSANRTFNPVLHRFYAAVQARMLDENAALPELDEVVRSYVAPVHERMGKRGKAVGIGMDAVKGAFHLDLRQSSDLLGEKRALDPRLAAAVGRKGGADGGAGSSSSTRAGTKRSREEEAAAYRDTAAAASVFGSKAGAHAGGHAHVASIGTSHPGDDFRAMLRQAKESRSTEELGKAFDGMEGAVLKLAAAADKDRDAGVAGKAVDAVRSLREGAIENVEEARFNAFLHTVKGKFCRSGGSAAGTFWPSLASAGVTLISEDEGATSVPASEAADFLTVTAAAVGAGDSGKGTKDEGQAVPAADEEEEDDDGDLELE